jgi:ribosome-binding protein aMBF1 (putative translation factor)
MPARKYEIACELCGHPTKGVKYCVSCAKDQHIIKGTENKRVERQSYRRKKFKRGKTNPDLFKINSANDRYWTDKILNEC